MCQPVGTPHGETSRVESRGIESAAGWCLRSTEVKSDDTVPTSGGSPGQSEWVVVVMRRRRGRRRGRRVLRYCTVLYGTVWYCMVPYRTAPYIQLSRWLTCRVVVHVVPVVVHVCCATEIFPAYAGRHVTSRTSRTSATHTCVPSRGLDGAEAGTGARLRLHAFLDRGEFSIVSSSRWLPGRRACAPATISAANGPCAAAPVGSSRRGKAV